MRKTPLLQAICTVALLAAAPAFAQSTPPAPTDNSGNAPGGGAPTAQETQPKHPSGTMHRRSAKRSGRTDTSQNEAVDRLNDQSYQASQRGETFSGGGADTGSAGTARPAAPSDMGNMPGGSSGSMQGGSMSGSDATGK
jgi:hypothetical protein